MKGKSLKVIVRSYELNNKHHLKEHLNYYRNLEDIEDVIKKATFAICSNGKKHAHQRRLKKKVMSEVKDNLLKKIELLLMCKDFDDLMNIVTESSVKGFGELAIYDTSLRVSAYLNILPQKIYLHSGTLRGAKLLGLKTTKDYLSLEEVPEEFRKLAPYEIEDILCIYKDELKGAI